MKRHWKKLVFGAVLLLVALVALRFGGGRRGVAVDVEEVTRRELFTSTVTASGEIVATRYADIGSSIMGRVVELPVVEGQEVAAGQVVARIDPVQARSSAEAAEAQVAAARAEENSARERSQQARWQLDVAQARAVEAEKKLARARALADDGVLAQADLDAAEAAAEVARGELETSRAEITAAQGALAAAERRVAQAEAQAMGARDLLEKTEIVAPMAGRVTRLNVRQGEMVVIGIQNQPGTTLMTLSDMASLNAEVKVAEADVLRLELGQPATVTLEALPERTFPGQVEEIGASALPPVGPGAAAREFRVVVGLEADEPRLRPGLTCDAEIVTDQRRDVLTVPLQAVVLRRGSDGGEREGVFTVAGGRARFVAVETGIIGGIDVEIAGVEVGTPVVVGPFQVLRELDDGARVHPERLDR
jgi:HlyD family secretion protein